MGRGGVRRKCFHDRGRLVPGVDGVNMAALKHNLQKELFNPTEERLYAVVSVKAGKKKKQSFLCLAGMNLSRAPFSNAEDLSANIRPILQELPYTQCLSLWSWYRLYAHHLWWKLSLWFWKLSTVAPYIINLARYWRRYSQNCRCRGRNEIHCSHTWIRIGIICECFVDLFEENPNFREPVSVIIRGGKYVSFEP